MPAVVELSNHRMPVYRIVELSNRHIIRMPVVESLKTIISVELSNRRMPMQSLNCRMPVVEVSNRRMHMVESLNTRCRIV